MCLPLSIGPIMDVLQFSQKNLATQMENLGLKSKYEELHLKYLDGFLGTGPQVMEEAQKQEHAKAEI